MSSTNPPEMPRMPEMPELPSSNAPRRGGWMVALFSITTIALILGAISVVSVGFTIVVGGVIGMIAFHYFVWGWWLGKIIMEEEAAAGSTWTTTDNSTSSRSTDA